MDKENLKSIFDKYIERFYMFNDPEHGEYYKWEIANKFPDMMKQALTSPDNLFSKELLKVKKLTENIIDNWTTPFYGLCKLAEQEPGAVRDLFNDHDRGIEAVSPAWQLDSLPLSHQESTGRIT